MRSLQKAWNWRGKCKTYVTSILVSCISYLNNEENLYHNKFERKAVGDLKNRALNPLFLRVASWILLYKLWFSISEFSLHFNSRKAFKNLILDPDQSCTMPERPLCTPGGVSPVFDFCVLAGASWPGAAFTHLHYTWGPQNSQVPRLHRQSIHISSPWQVCLALLLRIGSVAWEHSESFLGIPRCCPISDWVLQKLLHIPHSLFNSNYSFLPEIETTHKLPFLMHIFLVFNFPILVPSNPHQL